MSGLLRSRDMTYVRLVMFEESATETIRKIGKDFGKLHIVDKGETDSNHYKKYKLRGVDLRAWEKKLYAFRSVMEQQDVKTPGKEVDPQPLRITGDLIEALKGYFDPVEEDLGIHVNFKKQHTQLVNEQIEHMEVLKMCRSMAFRGPAAANGPPSQYGSVEEKVPDENMATPLLDEEASDAATFSQTMSGAISAVQQSLFERMIFRVSRGNAILSFQDCDQPITDPATGELVKKVVFNIIVVRGGNMSRRIVKICQFFGANIYQVPDNASDLERALVEAERKLTEHNAVLDRTKDRITDVLSNLAYDHATGSSPIVDWLVAVQQENATMEAMKRTSLLQGDALGRSTQQQVVVCVGWSPSEELRTLQRICDSVNSSLKSQQVVLSEEAPPRSPPTYFKTNKFTNAFQVIVDTYGMARYKEVNPGLFTIITFPFLYGVMYGDMFHGTCVFLFSLYILWNEAYYERQQKIGQMSEMFAYCFNGRYVILLMSLFAMYCGTIYCDCASIPVDLFGSRWVIAENEDGSYNVTQGEDWPYPFGVDPNWIHKKNELTFLNSLKMKMSIILGVIHMCFGIFMGLLNHLHFDNWTGVVFEFIPRMVFMLTTFGYMSFIIIYKWCIDWYGAPRPAGLAPGPPNLIQTMIGMFLNVGVVEDEVKLYEGQDTIQVILLLCAGICVPIMLFGEPIAYKMRFNRMYGSQRRQKYRGPDGALDDLGEEAHSEEEGGHAVQDDHHHGFGPNYSFGDHMVNQSIHTIEFVLGAVSNTASYLRLWALSLAHQQLAKVFWDKAMMEYGLNVGNPIFAMIGFGAWAGITAAVLLGMDVVECFLHALRLHWVEFQNKFFYADGYKFVPFSFEDLDEED